jgi:leucyl/phenylalanyl-tRNA---protein transferase
MHLRLSPELLVAAYSRGLFPMAEEDGSIGWYDPDPRGVIPLDAFHVPRRLAKTVRSNRFEIRVDTSFREVMSTCAAPSRGREDTWISDEMIEAYAGLHRLGLAHSVESWRDGRLVGGLYGVAIGGLFAGESMFSRETDASKVALVNLVARLVRGGFVLLDSQYLVGSHLRQFGAIDIPAREYKRRLAAAVRVHAGFPAEQP